MQINFDFENLPDEIKETIITSLRHEIDAKDEEINKRRADQQRGRISRLFSGIGRHVGTITILFALLGMLGTMIKFEYDRRRDIETSKMDRERFEETQRQAEVRFASERFFKSVEDFTKFITPFNEENKYAILGIIGEMRLFISQYRRHGPMVSSLMIPIILTENEGLSSLRRTAAYAFANGLEIADQIEFQNFLEESQRMLAIMIARQESSVITEEESQLMTTVVCALSYTSERLGMPRPPASADCPKPEFIFR